jgi:hypothetical protein
MQTQHHLLAKAAIAATLTATLLAPRAAFAQSMPGANAPATSIQQAVNGPEPDPNMPALPYALPGAPITWSPRGETPLVSFLKPSSQGSYLGFNERGSWIRNENDRKIYVWNLKDRTLTLGAESDAGVPLDLRNPSRDMKDLIAIGTGHGRAGVTSASTEGRRTPYIPPSVNGDGNAQYAGREARSGNPAPGTSSSASASGRFKGSGATIKAGVLTFTLDDPASPDNGKPVSLKVMRPAMTNTNAARPNGIAGAWLGEDPKNKDGVITLYVQGENGAVSGNAMNGFAAETLKKLMNANKP